MSSASSAPPPASNRTPTFDGYPITELATHDDTRPFRLDAPEPPTGYADFHPVTNLAWAQRMARIWSEDAVLTGIRVRGVSRDGSLNVTNASGQRVYVEYSFGSAAKTEEARAAAEVRRAGLPTSRLDLLVRRALVGADLTSATQPVQPAQAPNSSCTLSDLMARWRDEGLLRRPSYSVTLDRYGWTVSHGETTVDATTCQPRR